MALIPCAICFVCRVRFYGTRAGLGGGETHNCEHGFHRPDNYRAWPRGEGGDCRLSAAASESTREDFFVCPRHPHGAQPFCRAPTLFTVVSEIFLDDGRRNNLKVLLT